jgi:hypothetical protein
VAGLLFSSSFLSGRGVEFPNGGLLMSTENIILIVVIVLVVLFVLGYFGRGRFRR